MSIFDVDSGMDWSREGPYASHEAMLRATLEAKQLDAVLVWGPEWQRRQIHAIPTPDGLPVVLVSQSIEQVWVCQETASLDLQAWIASVYDCETKSHVQRVTWLAEATARYLAQSEEDVHQLRLAALLHDIGKVGIPAVILHKPGPLTLEEWSILQRHPEIGRHLLEQAGGIFYQVASIVGMHHERWDGHGYPRGVATDNIPLHARILTVVDAYDAMTSQRVYQRNPYSVTQACQELHRCAGSQFDPRVVQAFLQMLEKHPTRAVWRKR